MITLTKPEWILMNTLWEKSPLTLSGVIEAVGDQLDWKYTTYSTYLKRLCDKGVARYEMLGRDKFYYPAIDRNKCIRAESESILDRISGSGLKDLLVCMIKESSLSSEDMQELKELFDELADKENEK
ncbi:MAG: BlaI/MecI/CopY family transcriptional regulator [Caldicoprobacterales bacterium]|jgi:BlaI family penicillinase repressor|nr:BlaI/MecI/CopY family transcriptional regulator [Clostridiales bacterium]